MTLLILLAVFLGPGSGACQEEVVTVGVSSESSDTRMCLGSDAVETFCMKTFLSLLYTTKSTQKVDLTIKVCALLPTSKPIISFSTTECLLTHFWYCLFDKVRLHRVITFPVCRYQPQPQVLHMCIQLTAQQLEFSTPFLGSDDLL